MIAREWWRSWAEQAGFGRAELFVGERPDVLELSELLDGGYGAPVHRPVPLRQQWSPADSSLALPDWFRDVRLGGQTSVSPNWRPALQANCR